jgi:carbon-monoxide dehydrogenase medium subunit
MSVLWKQYFTPASLDEAVDLLAEHADRARIVAGATDIILELQRGIRPGIDTLIDITRIPDLDHITLDASDRIHLGPLVTHNHCAGSKMLIDRAFALSRACWEVGAPQIRNRGTIAGNLVTASPANDSITPLVALSAELKVRSKAGQRTIPIAGFYTGVRETALAADELVVDISFPAPKESTRSAFVKIGLRRAQAISIVNVAIVLEFSDNLVERASIALGSVAPTIIRAQQAESHLIGKELSSEVIENASSLAVGASAPIDDLRGSAAYRKEMVRVATARALQSIQQGDERQGYPTDPIMLWGERESQRLNGSFLHHSGAEAIEASINGKSYSVSTGQDKTLLRWLREDLGLIGTKEGCAEGECGACTVFLDGMAVMACMVPAPRAHKAEIITIEGLAKDGQLHPIQQGFIEQGAVQCGYCTPGFIMSAAKLIDERMNPTESEIKQAITGNLCRCTGYYSIISAIKKSVELASAKA